MILERVSHFLIHRVGRTRIGELEWRARECQKTDCKKKSAQGKAITMSFITRVAVAASKPTPPADFPVTR